MDMDGEDPIDGTAGTEAPISSLAQVQNVCCLGASLSGVVNMLVMASNHHAKDEGIIKRAKMAFIAVEAVMLGKIAVNSILAMKYNILRTISELFELVHTNFEDVEKVIRMGRRVGLHIDSNLGIGGQGLTNDLRMWTIRNKKIAVFGVSKEYKQFAKLYGNTDLQIAVFNKRVEIAVEAHRAWEGAHAIVFLVDSDEFEELPWGDIHETMGKPSFIFVGCNLNLNFDTVRTLGFNQYIS
ncbi:hypothetical protein ACFX1S_040016 [Malus domestica]